MFGSLKKLLCFIIFYVVHELFVILILQAMTLLYGSAFFLDYKVLKFTFLGFTAGDLFEILLYGKFTTCNLNHFTSCKLLY